MKSWFGYGLHLIADTHYEVPVAFEVTRASRTETKVLAEMLEGLFAEAPEMVDRCDDFSADRGLDNAPQKKQLWDKWTVRPLIDTRLMWKAEKEEPGYDPERPITRPLFPERADVIVHDERGRVSCICPETGEVRAMAFQGFEAERGVCGTIKYRCPATAFGFDCAGQQGVPPGGRGEARGVRPHRARRSGQARPAHLHADALGQPILAARIQPTLGDGADQQPPRQQLQLRDPLHPRARQDEDPCRAGAGGDDGAGPRAGAGWPRRADALTGRRRAVPRHRLTARLPSDIAARPGRLPAQDKPRPPVSARSRSVPISRQIAAFCSPGGGRQSISARQRSPARRRKAPQRTFLLMRRVRCRGSLGEQGLWLIRDFSYPSGVADFCGPGVGEEAGSAIFTPRPAMGRPCPVGALRGASRCPGRIG